MCIPSARNVRSKCKFRSRAISRYATRNFDLTKFLFIENWSMIAPRNVEPDTWIHEQPIRQLVTARVKRTKSLWMEEEKNGIWILFFFFFFWGLLEGNIRFDGIVVGKLWKINGWLSWVERNEERAIFVSGPLWFPQSSQGSCYLIGTTTRHATFHAWK